MIHAFPAQVGAVLSRYQGQDTACSLDPHTQPDSMLCGRSSGLLCWMPARHQASWLGSSCTARALPLETLLRWAPSLPRTQVRLTHYRRPFVRRLEALDRLEWMMVQMLQYVV